MKRIIAYNLYQCEACRQMFFDKLRNEGFEVTDERLIKTKGVDNELGHVDTYLVIYPPTNRTNKFDISESTRLTRIADEFKIE